MNTADRVRHCLAHDGVCFPDEFRHDPVRPILELAASALEEEDRALERALTLGRDRSPEGYQDISRGLAYWLFETTLVYAIFKALAPRIVARWEHPCADAGGKKADLVLFPSASEGWVFEAKWWNDDSSKTHRAILDDVEKLEPSELATMKNPLAQDGASSTWRRFILFFAFGDTEKLETEWAPFDAFDQKPPLRFLSAFSTHIYKTWPARETPRFIDTGYFAMGALELSEASG